MRLTVVGKRRDEGLEREDATSLNAGSGESDGNYGKKNCWLSISVSGGIASETGIKIFLVFLKVGGLGSDE